jgi:hypothetical protein
MADEWYVRVAGQQYGPVDLDTLREWRTEGRLIPTNEIRRATDADWRQAAEVAELFARPTPPPLPAVASPHRRTLSQIIAQSFVIYWRGFWTFLVLSLLVAIPSVVMKVSFAYVQMPQPGTIAPESLPVAAVSLVALILVLVAWPIFVAGLQFAAADLLEARPIRTRDILRRATNFWPRIAQLSIVVYGAFFFWTALPLIVIFSMVGGGPSMLSLLLAVLALTVQVYMFGRLFVNFLFWQETATLGGLPGVEALRDSKELARSRPSAPSLERPVYRGAILASFWLVVLVGAGIATELPLMMIRLQGITTIEEATVLVQKLMNATTPDTLTLIGYVLSTAVNAILRPLLGISFVLLYFDAKARL